MWHVLGYSRRSRERRSGDDKTRHSSVAQKHNTTRAWLRATQLRAFFADLMKGLDPVDCRNVVHPPILATNHALGRTKNLVQNRHQNSKDPATLARKTRGAPRTGFTLLCIHIPHRHIMLCNAEASDVRMQTV